MHSYSWSLHIPCQYLTWTALSEMGTVVSIWWLINLLTVYNLSDEDTPSINTVHSCFDWVI